MYFIKYLYLAIKLITMAKKRMKAGRPKSTDKVKMMSAYLKESEIEKVKTSFGNLTKAVRAKVLPKCA